MASRRKPNSERCSRTTKRIAIPASHHTWAGSPSGSTPPMSAKKERSLSGGGVSANSGVKYCAPPTSREMPPTRDSVPSVTTNDGIRTIVVKNALTSPTAAPPPSASRRARYRLSPSFIHSTPSRIGAKANVAPMERSISAAMMTRVWPSATIASELAERTRSIRFAVSKKFELMAPKTMPTAMIATHSPPTRARMWTAWNRRLSAAASGSPLRASSTAGSEMGSAAAPPPRPCAASRGSATPSRSFRRWPPRTRYGPPRCSRP